MKAKILKITRQKTSKREGSYFHIFFKGEDGRSYKTMVVLAYRNFRNWQWALNHGIERWFSGLEIKKDDIIDADSIPKPCDPPEEKSNPKPTVVYCPLFGAVNFDKAQMNLREARSKGGI